MGKCRVHVQSECVYNYTKDKTIRKSDEIVNRSDESREAFRFLYLAHL